MSRGPRPWLSLKVLGQRIGAKRQEGIEKTGYVGFSRWPEEGGEMARVFACGIGVIALLGAAGSAYAADLPARPVPAWTLVKVDTLD